MVYGYDISSTHLKAADEYLKGIGVRNIELKHVSRVKDIEKLPKVDLVYSVIVLQHNPPPLISLMIREFIRALNPGGLAYFQLPTYRKGYSFSATDYLKGALSQEIEMHVLPQKKVFEIVQQEKGRVVEVIEDSWTGGRYKELSNTFLIQKE
jgi:SAM-dependent methyltransferase